MCGIAGIFSERSEPMGRRIIGMTDALAHRGPDDFGYVALDPGMKSPGSRTRTLAHDVKARLFFGHRRLSIIDLSGTRQPLCNEDGSVWTVFNGEIYNYGEIRERLEAKGHILRDKGDTEVLVHLWEEYRENMPEHLNGMFAFAIYDTREDILFIARDRFGEKPLFYFESDRYFYFASELQAFFCLDDFQRGNIDDIAASAYFRYGFIPSPRTIFKGVYSLRPGTSLLRKKHKSSIGEYWSPSLYGNLQLDYEKLENLLDQSVKSRLKTDVPFGVFLSGGIDSGLITESMSRQLPSPVRTFTVTTDKTSRFDESEAAKATADFLGTEHNVLKVEPDFASIAEKLAGHFGQPFADHSSVLTYCISRETRKFVTVAFGGDGGDELFAGYGSYLNADSYQIAASIPFPFRIMLAKAASSFPVNFDSPSHLPDSMLSACNLPSKGENISSLFHRYWREKAYTEDFMTKLNGVPASDLEVFSRYYDSSSAIDRAARWMECDQKMYLCDDILSKVDICSMAVSLECRAPFLDHRLAEYVNSVSIREKIGEGRSKQILRRIAYGKLPAGISELPKKGFSMPLGKWINSGLRDWINSLLCDNVGELEPFIRKDFVRSMLDQHRKARIDHQARIWALASFVLWKQALRKIPYIGE